MRISILTDLCSKIYFVSRPRSHVAQRVLSRGARQASSLLHRSSTWLARRSTNLSETQIAKRQLKVEPRSWRSTDLLDFLLTNQHCLALRKSRAAHHALKVGSLATAKESPIPSSAPSSSALHSLFPSPPIIFFFLSSLPLFSCHFPL